MLDIEVKLPLTLGLHEPSPQILGAGGVEGGGGSETTSSSSEEQTTTATESSEALEEASSLATAASSEELLLLQQGDLAVPHATLAVVVSAASSTCTATVTMCDDSRVTPEGLGTCYPLTRMCAATPAPQSPPLTPHHPQQQHAVEEVVEEVVGVTRLGDDTPSSAGSLEVPAPCTVAPCTVSPTTYVCGSRARLAMQAVADRQEEGEAEVGREDAAAAAVAAMEAEAARVAAATAAMEAAGVAAVAAAAAGEERPPEALQAAASQTTEPFSWYQSQYQQYPQAAAAAAAANIPAQYTQYPQYPQAAVPAAAATTQNYHPNYHDYQQYASYQQYSQYSQYQQQHYQHYTSQQESYWPTAHRKPEPLSVAKIEELCGSLMRLKDEVLASRETIARLERLEHKVEFIMEYLKRKVAQHESRERAPRDESSAEIRQRLQRMETAINDIEQHFSLSYCLDERAERRGSGTSPPGSEATPE